MNAHTTYNVGPISVTKHIIDWNDLEGGVRTRLAAVVPCGTIYLNPKYSVAGPGDAPIELFVKQARRARVLWNWRLARALGSGARKRPVKQADSNSPR
jgi:hypothetical protein